MVSDIQYESSLGKSDHLILSFKFNNYSDLNIKDNKYTRQNFLKGDYHSMGAFGILPMVPFEILPMVPLVANGTIGNTRTPNVSRLPMVPLVPMLPLVETIGKPDGVNSSIMINTTSLFLHSYFLCVYFSISIICEYHPDKNRAHL